MPAILFLICSPAMGMSRVERIWPNWCQTVGQMRDEGVEVHAHCSKCMTTLNVDLDALCTIRGRSFSLIDRTGACKVVRYPGRVFFLASRIGSGVPMMRLTSRGVR